MLPSYPNTGTRILSYCQGARCRHPCQNKNRALVFVGERRGWDGLLERIDDSFSCQDRGVNCVRKLGDLWTSSMILLLDGMANIDELAVFKEHKIVLLGGVL